MELDEILSRIQVVSMFLKHTDYTNDPEAFVRRLQLLGNLSQQALQTYLNPPQSTQ